MSPGSIFYSTIEKSILFEPGEIKGVKDTFVKIVSLKLRERVALVVQYLLVALAFLLSLLRCKLYGLLARRRFLFSRLLLIVVLLYLGIHYLRSSSW